MINNSQCMKIIQYLSILGGLLTPPPPVPTPKKSEARDKWCDLTGANNAGMSCIDLLG